MVTKLVVSEAIPKCFFKNCGSNAIVQFRGVDEVAWIKSFKPSKIFDSKKPLIVVRQMETNASYALGEKDTSLEVARKLSSLGTVLFFSRYVRGEISGLKVIKDFVDSASVVSYADLVIGAGGTMSREAALQGVPSVIVSEIGHTYVNTYLGRKGFPLFFADTSNVLSCAKRCLGKRFDMRHRLAELENPLDIIEKLVIVDHLRNPN